jgi:hypothetical protein
MMPQGYYRGILLICGWVALGDAHAWMNQAMNASELLIEVEAQSSTVAGEAKSDLLIATLDWNTIIPVNESMSWHVGLLWEQDVREDDPLDRLYVNGVWQGLGWTVGRFYQPVGRFDSIFISDPLTMELAELNQTSAMLDYTMHSFLIQAGLFRSSLNDVAGERGVDQGYAAITWLFSDATEVGVYWLSNLLESDGLSESGNALRSLNRDESAGGLGCCLHHLQGAVEVHLECVGGVQSVDTEGDVMPMALHAECSYAMNTDLRVGVRYEKSDDFYGSIDSGLWMEEFAESRTSVVLAHESEQNWMFCLEAMWLDRPGVESDERVAMQLSQLF